MKKAILKYEENGILTARYCHKKSNDYLRYKTIIRIKESGNNPIEIHLKFDGIYPFVAPMPPEEHAIKAASIDRMELFQAPDFSTFIKANFSIYSPYKKEIIKINKAARTGTFSRNTERKAL